MSNSKEAQKYEKLEDQFLSWAFQRYAEHNGYGPSKLDDFQISPLYGPESLPKKFLITEGGITKTRTRELLEALSQRGYVRKNEEEKYLFTYEGYQKATGGFSFYFKRCINEKEPYFVFFSFILLLLGTIATICAFFI